MKLHVCDGTFALPSLPSASVSLIALCEHFPPTSNKRTKKHVRHPLRHRRYRGFRGMARYFHVCAPKKLFDCRFLHIKGCEVRVINCVCVCVVEREWERERKQKGEAVAPSSGSTVAQFNHKYVQCIMSKTGADSAPLMICL